MTAIKCLCYTIFFKSIDLKENKEYIENIENMKIWNIRKYENHWKMVEQDAKFITTNFDSGFDDEYSGSK